MQIKTLTSYNKRPPYNTSSLEITKDSAGPAVTRLFIYKNWRQAPPTFLTNQKSQTRPSRADLTNNTRLSMEQSGERGGGGAASGGIKMIH